MSHRKPPEVTLYRDEHGRLMYRVHLWDSEGRYSAFGYYTYNDAVQFATSYTAGRAG